MRILAIDCATEACSVALFEGSSLCGSHHEVLGRGHAERLVPMIKELPGNGRADEIRIGRGPGSFTGTRIGLATARALGIAWKAEVRGLPTLALVAATNCDLDGPVTVCMAGGHGEWLVQNFGADRRPQDDPQSLPPDRAVKAALHSAIFGNRAADLAQALGDPAVRVNAFLPDARNALQVPEELLTPELSPIYAREPDAKLPA